MMTEQRVKDGYTPMYASLIVADREAESGKRKLVGVKMTFPTPSESSDQGRIEFDRELIFDFAKIADRAMIGFFQAPDDAEWQLLIRADKSGLREARISDIVALDVPEAIPPV